MSKRKRVIRLKDLPISRKEFKRANKGELRKVTEFTPAPTMLVLQYEHHISRCIRRAESLLVSNSQAGANFALKHPELLAGGSGWKDYIKKLYSAKRAKRFLRSLRGGTPRNVVEKTPEKRTLRDGSLSRKQRAKVRKYLAA